MRKSITQFFAIGAKKKGTRKIVHIPPSKKERGLHIPPPIQDHPPRPKPKQRRRR